MPRIYASNNDPIDLCKRCFPIDEEAAKTEFGNKGDGPDGRGNCFEYEAHHPDYGGLGYACYECGRRLADKDN